MDSLKQTVRETMLGITLPLNSDHCVSNPLGPVQAYQGEKTNRQIQYIHLNDVPGNLWVKGATVRRGQYIGTYGLFGEGVGSEPHLHITYKNVPLDDTDTCNPYHISPSEGLGLFGTSQLPIHTRKACHSNRMWGRAVAVSQAGNRRGLEPC